ncbi:MAG: ABC transporter permease [Turicibacter sp.]|nr:ABC transporter permease [Turicibacter sp.]
MSKIWTIIKFEFLTFAKSGTFIGMAIIMGLIAIVGPTVPTLILMLGGQETATRIAIVDNTSRFDAALFAPLNAELSFDWSIGTAIEALGNELDFVIEINEDGYILRTTSTGMAVFTMQNVLDSIFQAENMSRQFDQLGIDAQTIAGIMNFTVNSQIISVNADDDADESSFFVNILLAQAMGFLLYFAFILGGQYLVTTVVREKSTKTMEILITSAKTDYLIIGKVLGVLSLSLLQLLTIIGLLLLSMSVNSWVLTNAIDLGTVAEGATEVLMFFNFGLQPAMLTYFVLFFLLGFLIYAFLYAALASTVSRMEDAGNISTIPVLLILIAYLIMIFGVGTPDAAWITVASHIPFFTPLVMLLRIISGTVATWEIFVSIAAQILAVALMAWLGSRIYRMGTLMYGNKPKLKDILLALTN